TDSDRLAEEPEQPRAVVVVVEEREQAQPVRVHVVDAAGELRAQRASHLETVRSNPPGDRGCGQRVPMLVRGLAPGSAARVNAAVAGAAVEEGDGVGAGVRDVDGA